MHGKIQTYLNQWFKRGYGTDIPDEVPDMLRSENLAPSYKAIAMAILRHDHGLQSLGFAAEESPWYRTLKRIELSQRDGAQLWLF